MPDPFRRKILALILPPKEGFGPGRTGAVGMIAYRLALAARDNGEPRLEPVVVGAPTPEKLFPDIGYRAARPVSWLPLPGARRYGFGVARVLRDLRPDLIEVYNRVDLALFLAGRFPRIPVLLNLQNDPQVMRGARTPAERARVLARLAGVHANSGYILGRLLEGVDPGIARHPPAIVPNGLDLGALPAAPPAAAREKLVLFAGRVVHDKGVDSFVAACALALPRLPGWRAEIIGADRFHPESPDTDFIRDIRPRAAAAGVAMLGYLPHEDVLEAMRRAAIVVVPSRWQEPFGMTALEAMASGAALLCSARGGLAEVAGDSPARIDPDDPAAMSSVIVAVASDPARRAALSAAGLLRARMFDLGKITARLNALRRGALAAP